jgi:hypothetical protein
MKFIRNYIAVTILTAASACCVHAQQFGVSAQAIMHVRSGYDMEYAMNNTWPNSSRTITNKMAFAPGIRVEANYILPGFSAPISGYNGVGFSIIAPMVDSLVYVAQLKNSSWTNSIDILGTRKISMFNIGLRFGYEIPQTFNDFLLIHIGFGFGYSRVKQQLVLPETSSTFQYTEDDFEDGTFDPIKNGTVNLEILGGVVYEFEKFSLIGQYSVNIYPTLDIDNTPKLRHGPTLGVMVPFYRFM